ncbi:MAG: DUF4838 domain-containing protein [Clostridia bacterium]|nr:DUF4838 domain-containing protein [Clostridia bacterium]
MKKLLTLLLAAAILLPCLLGGCNSKDTPKETTAQTTTPKETTPEKTTPQDDPVITPEVKTMTLTTVKVTCGEDATELYAATELLDYLNKKGVTASEDGYPIHISFDEALGMDSFRIQATFGEDGGMTIEGGNGRGVIYAVYRFLEKYAGFRYLTPTIETQTEDDVVIPEGLVMEYAPTILARRMAWYGVAGQVDWYVKNGINPPSIPEELGGDYHNYGTYFVHSIAYLSESTYPYLHYATNPCLTDPEIYATVLKNVRKELETNPTTTIISVSQSDYEQSCYCPNCAKIAEENGGNYSGVWITFVNKIAEDIEEDYPNVMVDTLAYKNTQSPPTKVKPHKNVCVRLCSINCCFTHAINASYCLQNRKFCKDLRGWGEICDNVHIWDYNTNFHYFISTFANFGVLRANMQFFAENNVTSIFPHGNDHGVSGEFGELRAYLIAQLMWNPYMSEEEYYGYRDDFLKAYYGDGWTYIREFIDLTTRLARNGGYMLDGNEQPSSFVCGQGIYGHPLTAITRQEYLNYEYRFDECWALAEELAGDKVENVRRSMMQWRLTKLYLRPNADEAAKLIADAKAAGVVWKEGLPNVLASSDLSLSPYYWKYGS